MGVKKDLTDALRTAMKEKNEAQKGALRLALSSIKLAEVEKGEDLDDLHIYSILQKEIKTREETISEAEKAGREGMAVSLENEILELKKFLPSELTDDELSEVIKSVVSEVKAESIKQMGLVMKHVIEKVQGRASNDRISGIVRELLSSE